LIYYISSPDKGDIYRGRPDTRNLEAVSSLAGMSSTVITLVDLGLDPAIHHVQKQSASWKHVGLGVNPADDM